MSRTSAIPRFFLYGEPGREVEWDFLHIETIEARSRGLGWEIGAHSHAELAQILYLTDGDGTMQADSQHWTFQAPALLLMPPRVVHGFQFRPDTQGHVVTVAERFRDELCGGDALARQVMAHPACLTLTDRQAELHGLGPACTALGLEFVWRAAARGLAVRAQLLRLLAGAVRLAAEQRASPPQASAPQHHHRDEELVARFRELLETEFRRQLRVSAYADRLGVTEARLTTACRRRLGRPPLDLLHDRLVLEAKRALLYTPHSIGEIGFALGFRDPAYFCRFFRNRTGQTAGAFRLTDRRRRG